MSWADKYIADVTHLLPRRILVRVLADVAVEFSWRSFEDVYEPTATIGEKIALEATKATWRAIRAWCRGEVTDERMLEIEDQLADHHWNELLETPGESRAFVFLNSTRTVLKLIRARPRYAGMNLRIHAIDAILSAIGSGHFLEVALRQREKKIAALIQERLPTEPKKTEEQELHWPPEPSFPLITIGGGYALVNDQIFDIFTGSLYYEHGQDTTPTRVMIDWLMENGYL